MKSSPAKSAPVRSAAKKGSKQDDDAELDVVEVEAEDSATGEETAAASASGGKSTKPPKRRATAETMAAGQRDISVSEFFAKNRHLLGFDNPRKALLTTVKEAVDNSLDACEEAGILPEIWVHIEATGENRYKVGIQDNGPGIVKAQIPNIFGKLLYGSKFHRLRMSRGQQGIGISAAGMYGVLTTGKPVKIVSRIGAKKPAHYFELQIDTKKNKPEILNGKGEGVDIEPGDAGAKFIEKHGIEWIDVPNGTRVTIELEAKYQRGRGSVDEYLQQTAIANPHVTVHYVDPDGKTFDYARATDELPKEAKEILPHPYGIELGNLVTMLQATKASTLSQFLTSSFSRVSSSKAAEVCEAAKLSTRANPARIGRHDSELLYQALQKAKIPSPATDCISPIGVPLLLQGLHHVVPAEFYVADTRPPAVYRGNPFVIETALAYGGASTAVKVSLEALTEMLQESDARTLRQFLINGFSGIGGDAADKILAEAEFGTRASPSKLKPAEIAKLHTAMRNVNLEEGQTMNVLRYANRVPLQFQPGACAITQMIMGTNWRAYGLSQSRGGLPSGPVTVMVHIASVWVPFTSESKEAVASYPEIQKEIRLGLQAVGRKLAMFVRKRMKVKQEGERRNVFLRYLGEVAGAVNEINGRDKQKLYDMLLKVAKRKTAQADDKLDEQGKVIKRTEEEEYGDNVLIIKQEEPEAASESTDKAAKPKKKGGR
ncbi:MAG: DNA topoisomerase VI subunit B [Planctomycetaceae bacterium]|nr:DNA topoisomerase VI subunit B [Planctomycetaceae bacterium]